MYKIEGNISSIIYYLHVEQQMHNRMTIIFAYIYYRLLFVEHVLSWAFNQYGALFLAFCTAHLFNIWNENQLMSLFYSYIAGSLHVSGPQAHLQESSYSCSHNHWFSFCAALFACSLHPNRAAQKLNQWLCEQLYELSWRWACGTETCRDPAIYE